ncbi:MAG: SDR family oxidoreductase, partial [Solirubrobacterales bacterium]|nr:SDR family oxidoreductase [Solirubrobacterales bacterium]
AALITGASRGIGFAVAEELAAEGYALTLTARKPDGLAAAEEKLRAAGAEAVSLAADVRDEAALQAVVERHRSAYGRLDVLVNNAGVGIAAPAGEQVTKYVDMQLEVNVRTLVVMYRETLDLLKADGGAQVINLASIAGKSPQPLLSVYSATKSAVLAYSEAMNKELSASGVWSTALCPGFVDTDMTEFAREWISQEDMIRTSDIAAAVRFLLSLSSAARVPEIVIQRPGEDV